MIRSLSFGYYYYNYTNFKYQFHSAYSLSIKLAITIKLLTHYAKGTLSLKKLQLIINIKFQELFKLENLVSFSPFPHGTSLLSIIKSFFNLEGGSPIFE